MKGRIGFISYNTEKTCDGLKDRTSLERYLNLRTVGSESFIGKSDLYSINNAVMETSIS
jgi:hypothetical protein